eukprot:39043-Amphidinium_carterae.2
MSTRAQVTSGLLSAHADPCQHIMLKLSLRSGQPQCQYSVPCVWASLFQEGETTVALTFTVKVPVET